MFVLISQTEDVDNIVNSPPPFLLLLDMESARDKSLLLVLNIQHLLLHRLLGDELVDEDLLGLAEPVDPVEALPLTGGVPGGVQQQQVVRRSQIQAHAASLQTEQDIYYYYDKNIF